VSDKPERMTEEWLAALERESKKGREVQGEELEAARREIRRSWAECNRLRQKLIYVEALMKAGSTLHRDRILEILREALDD